MAKVLQVNKYYYRKGGAESVMLDTMDILARAGHEVIPFAMAHPDNLSTPFSYYFVSNVEYSDFEKMSPSKKLRAAGSLIYSAEARQKMDHLLRDVHPDIAHLHNIYHQLSPSILSALKQHCVPTVMTLHDYKLLCPNYIMLNQKGLCEACAGHHFLHAVMNRCVKKSAAKSALCAVEMYLHTWLGLYERGVDIFIAPSQFLRQRLIAQKKIPSERVIHIPNAVDITAHRPCYENQGYALYFGRLERHKGVFLLADAMQKIPQTRLVIAGTGAAEEELDALIKKRGQRNVEMVGYQSGDALSELIRGASVVVVPSLWYENCPMSIIEAFAFGKPVIGARLGGIPEMVDDGVDGLLFDPADAESLSKCIETMVSSMSLAARMGEMARKKAVSRYSSAMYMERLQEVYDRLLRNAGTKRDESCVD